MPPEAVRELVQEATMADQANTPNLYELSGHGIQVTYSTRSFAGPPQFQYKDSHADLTFSGDEIETQDGGILGTFITVTIRKSIDSDFTTFTLLLPQIGSAESDVHFSTLGIVTVHHRTLAGPRFIHGPLQQYHAYTLFGTAQTVEFLAGGPGKPSTKSQPA